MPSLLTERPTLPWELLLEPQGRRGAEHMGTDQALLAEAAGCDRAFLRLYRFDPPCLSLGRNEPAARYDRPAIARLGLDVVRRPTGGRAVWHEHEVTYAVAAPIAAFGSLPESYRAIHQRLAAALRTLGADATLAPPVRRIPRPGDGACFATPVGGEVVVNGRKLVGSAQARLGGAFLQHGSILLAGSQDVIIALSRQPPAGAAASREPQAVSPHTTLSTELGRHVAWEEVVEAIVSIWANDSAPTLSSRPLPSFTAPYRPLPSSAALSFSDPAWTWRC
jgi:lipoate-protein ligase A